MFLAGMMVAVGVLRDLGLFDWLIAKALAARGLNAETFVVGLCVLGAASVCLVDEVTSIVFVAAFVFDVCDALRLRPAPYLMMAVFATNVGSAGTMLGNPVGVLIGQNAQPPFFFHDFLVWSLPAMLCALLATYVLIRVAFRRDLAVLGERLRARTASLVGAARSHRPDAGRARLALWLLFAIVAFIGSHHAIVRALGLRPNTMLVVAPLLSAGLLLLWRGPERARRHLEHDIEWPTLMFFMTLFAVAGTLRHTGVTTEVAERFQRAFADQPGVLPPLILGLSLLGSAFVDNIVFVASFLPVVDRLESTPLYWALLHGACIGGNVTMIGSTANIVALGLMEKRYGERFGFWGWLKTGALAGLAAGLAAWLALGVLAPHMPTAAERRAAHAATARP